MSLILLVSLYRGPPFPPHTISTVRTSGFQPPPPTKTVTSCLTFNMGATASQTSGYCTRPCDTLLSGQSPLRTPPSGFRTPIASGIAPAHHPPPPSSLVLKGPAGGRLPSSFTFPSFPSSTPGSFSSVTACGDFNFHGALGTL